MDFNSPKHLAEYLNYLDKNVTAYNSYFKWKKHISFFKNSISFAPICNMCIQLQLENYFGIKKSLINDLAGYWSRKRNCKGPKIHTVQQFNFVQLN